MHKERSGNWCWQGYAEESLVAAAPTGEQVDGMLPVLRSVSILFLLWPLESWDLGPQGCPKGLCEAFSPHCLFIFK